MTPGVGKWIHVVVGWLINMSEWLSDLGVNDLGDRVYVLGSL